MLCIGPLLHTSAAIKCAIIMKSKSCALYPDVKEIKKLKSTKS